MNPFDLTGPQFLLFYAGAVAAVILGARLMLHQLGGGEDSGAPRAMDLTRDPYAIAYLRGGRSQALQAAFISLMDRSLLRGSEKNLQAADAEGARRVHHPLEQAILSAFAHKKAVASTFADATIVSALDAIGDKLEALGLLCGKRLRTCGIAFFWVGLLVLWTIAGGKIVIALSRGRTNILFLTLMALIAPFLLHKATRLFKTRAGSRMIANLKLTFADLYSRRKSVKLHRPTTELVMLAALFGLGSLPADASSMAGSVKRLKSSKDTGGGCGSGCGSGSSCGGSSCGGGGCGGCG